MSTPVPSTFPDIEAIVVDLLRNRPELGGAVVDESPPAGFNGTQRAVIVSRRGGAWVEDLHVDQPLIELEVYGPDKTSAHVLTNAARAVLLRSRGLALGTSVITDVSEADGPRWQPDFVYAGANRYQCVLRMTVRTS
ncbi:hypothetical protein ACIQ9E_17575 [Streptomyces sp. NPDC094448]|uniref:hypothetical protein n=1 Tax=Streptomyces sp. NPDC094448 TaxID=3366063 RepID=UPI003824F73C